MQKEKTFEAIKDGKSVQMTEQTYNTLGGEAAGWKRVSVVPDDVQKVIAAAEAEKARLEEEERIKKENALHDLHLQVERLNETIADKDLHIESLQHTIRNQADNLSLKAELIAKLEGGEELKRARIEELENEITKLKTPDEKPAPTPKKK